jgi:hypothetical protein
VPHPGQAADASQARHRIRTDLPASAARDRLAAGQLELEVETVPPGPGGPLRISSSRMGYLIVLDGTGKTVNRRIPSSTSLRLTLASIP